MDSRVLNAPDRDLVKAWHGYGCTAQQRNWDDFHCYNVGEWQEQTIDIFRHNAPEGMGSKVWTIEAEGEYHAEGVGSTEDEAWHDAAETIRCGTEDENIIRALDAYNG